MGNTLEDTERMNEGSVALFRAPRPLSELAARYRAFAMTPGALQSTLLSLGFFIVSILANYRGSAYATEKASNYVDDLILSNTPVFEVAGFFVWGAVALIAFIAILCLLNPRRIPFIVYSLSIFYFTRAIFITLTHLGPFPTHAPIDFDSSIGIFFSKLFFGDDLFFSGHTGAPFMMALLYWRESRMRFLFLGWSLFMALVVLLGHLHYSIDVASAFFITFGLYHFACWLFPREFTLFQKSQPKV
jgi:hypothetical protein